MKYSKCLQYCEQNFKEWRLLKETMKFKMPGILQTKF